MHRLFVALRPPPPMRQALLALMGGVVNARWQDDSQLHLTLRFIGAVDPRTAEEVAAALASVRHPPIRIALDRIGQFDRKGRLDALWVGVTPAEAVAALHHKIDRLLVSLGLPSEGRAYHPHITIARFGRHHGTPINLFEGAPVPRVEALFDSFCLYESQLGHDGATYSIVERYPLG